MKEIEENKIEEDSKEELEIYSYEKFEGEEGLLLSPSPKSDKHKIVKYKLQPYVLDLFFNDGMTFGEIAKACNVALELRKEKGDTYPYFQINASNVSHFLDSMRDRITSMKQDAFEETIKGVQVVDKVKHLNALITSAYERRLSIREMMTESFETGDKKNFFNAVNSDRQNDQQIVEVTKALTTLEERASTYVTVDYVKSIIMRVVDKVLKNNEIDDVEKMRLALDIQDCVDFDTIDLGKIG